MERKLSASEILNSPELKPLEKRAALSAALRSGDITTDDVAALPGLTDKKLAAVLEAMEEISRETPELSGKSWLRFAEARIDSPSNSVKREASRVVGNIAHLHAGELGGCIEKLLANTADEGTVVRWASAYALAKIVVIPQYANSALYGKLAEICGGENENGVKNQYLKALRKASKLRG
jgi:HEAT repeat protein